MKFTRWLCCLLSLLGLAASCLQGAESSWKAGVARAVITPSEPMWMAGYGSRKRPSEGAVMELWIKVLALEDSAGKRVVILTSDTLGFPQSIYQNVCKGLKAQQKLEPSQVILSASHTHCGPVLQGALYDMYPLGDKEREQIERYSVELETKIIRAIGEAITNLSPARLVSGQGQCGFAVNRRNNKEADVPRLMEQGALKGPVDHSVPVLAVMNPNGGLKAVLFGYACHNTVMDFYQWSGDYAGYAQLALERSHTNAMALFLQGCGGDQNPLPRRKNEFAARYGNMLAASVEEIMRKPMRTLQPELRTAMEMVDLKFGQAPTTSELEQMKQGKDEFGRRWASRLLDEMKAGKPMIRTYPYPVQAWGLGEQLLITLGGETVVDYALAYKKEFGNETWVAGYCNDVMTYVPSLRVLKEGGYEGGGANIVYGMPAYRWADDVEATITGSVRRLVGKVIAGKQ